MPTLPVNRIHHLVPSARVIICVDQHTPVVAFRLRSLAREILRRGLQDRVQIEVLLLAGNETWSQWGEPDIERDYAGLPVTMLAGRHHGGSLREVLRWRTLKAAAGFLGHLVRRRPRLVLVEGYERVGSILAVSTAWLFRWRVGVMHDAQFEYSYVVPRRAGTEHLKSLLLRRYHLFLCSGRACAEYTRFLAGSNRPVYTHAWDIVDNQGIAESAAREDVDGEIYRHFALAPDTPYFLTPVRFIEHKNVSALLDAYKRFLAACPAQAPALVICGHGPLRSEYARMCDELGLTATVRIVDWLDYELVPRAMRMATAVILPSTCEQWGMVVNESLAAGSPVLVSQRCGARELVRENCNGFTFAPGDTEHLCLLMLQLANDRQLRNRLADNAPGSLHEWTIDSMLRQWLSAFATLGLTPDT